MISIIRRMVHSKIGVALAFLLIALAALAFAAGDITGSGGGLGVLGGNAHRVAKVGGGEITVSDLQGRTQMVFDRQRQQSPELQMSAFVGMGAVDDVLRQLIDGMALTQFANKEGMYNSKRLVDGEIGSIDAFKDPTGKFSDQLYQDLLRRQGITDRALRQDISRDLYARQLLTPVSAGSRMSRDMVLPYASLLLEGRKGRIAIVPSKLFLDTAPPDPKALAAYYAAHADRFTIPEQRQLRYLLVDKAHFAAQAKPSDAEIRQYYDAHKADYAAREQRTLEQVILPTQAAAQALAAKVKGGAGMEAAAKAAGLAASTFPDMTQEQFAEKSAPDVAKATFAAPAGTVATVTKSPLGWHVVRVAKLTSTPARSLESARAEIEGKLADQKAASAMADFISKAEDRIADGTTFDEIAKQASLAVKATPLITSTGKSPEKADYQAPPELQTLLKPGFDMELDDDPQMVTIQPDAEYALLDVTDIKPAAPPPLDKVRDLVTQDYQLGQAAEKASAAADRILASVEKGSDLAKALAESGLKLPPPQPIGARRADIAQSGQRVPPPLALLFSMKQGTAKKLAAGGDQGFFIVRLDAIDPGDAGGQPDLVKAVRQQMSKVAGNEYAEQFTSAVRQDVGVRTNDAAIATVKRQLRGTAPAQ